MGSGMAQKPQSGNNIGESKRINRAVGVAEALGRTLDPVFRRRGFASRDLIANWKTIAPRPYGEVARPDRLAWPRGARGTEGATLYLRCAEGHTLALTHEADRIAAAINRYFGYVLVGGVRLSAEPFGDPTGHKAAVALSASPEERQRVTVLTENVGDANLREALQRLGEALAAKRDD